MLGNHWVGNAKVHGRLWVPNLQSLTSMWWYMDVTVTCVLSVRHPRFGGNSQHWGRCLGVCRSGAVPPAGSRGRAPGQGVWGQSPLKLEAFCCISGLFLSILEGIVEL